MWNPISALLRRRRRPVSEPASPFNPSDDLDLVVRESFPRPDASEALQRRVAALLPAEAPRRRALPLPPGSRWTVALALGGLLIVAGLSAGKRGPVAYAEDAPTAGTLAILDDRGNATALCPLKNTDVRAEISCYVSRVTVEQQFQSPSNSPVEAVYTFPLPADAAVDAMTMVLGDRTIEGEIKRRDEARRIYEGARERGQVAALLDQERPNIFTQQVANIMPGQQVRIRISYVSLLKYDDGAYEFSYPMVVGPRFTTGSSGYTAPGRRGEPSTNRRVEEDPGSTPVETDAEKITPPITPKGTRAGHNISLSVHVSAGVPIRDLHSVLHRIDTRREGETAATVTLRNGREIPNRDFILRFRTAGREIQTGVLAHAPEAGKSGYFTLIIQPPNAPPQDQVSAKEMVFVIDQTGSQSGEPIKKAKEVMRTCIRRLNPDDTFQLLGFNTDVFPCFPAPVKNTPENVKKALAFLEPLQGEGGTDILKSVDWALTMPDDPARLRMICYLTDGYVGDDFQILDYIRKHRGRARMFPFGIGDSVNRFLIEGMGKEGRGASEIVTLETDANAAAEKFYRRVSQPLLLNPTIDWGGLPVADTYPQVLPDVFTSAPIVVKGRYTRAAEGDITVRGLLRGRPWSQTVHVRLPEVETANSAIPTLWAREKIEDLQSRDYLNQQLGRPDPGLQEQIVSLALDYRLMTQHTSFVAVEQRVVNIGGKQRVVDVPVEMPHGVSYEGIFGGEAPVDGFTKAKSLTIRHGAMAEATGTGTEFPSRQFQVAGTYLNKKAPGRRNGSPYQNGLVEQDQDGLPDDAEFSNAYSLYWSPGSRAPVISNPTPAPSLVKPRGRRLQPQPPAAPVGSAKIRPRSKLSRGQASGTGGPHAKPEAPVTARVGDSRGTNGLTGREPSGSGPARAAEWKISPQLQSRTGGLEIQIWISRMPDYGLRQLEKLGFQLAAELRPGQLLLGMLPAERLNEVARLKWVLLIDKPRFK